MKSLHVKKGDRVKVISGKRDDKGKVGEIIAVDVERQRVTVSGVNVVTRHRRDSVNGAGQQVKGGIISSEAPIHVSNVQLVTKVDGKEVVTRAGYKREEVTKTRPDGSEYTTTRSVRYLKKDEKGADK
ncbi:50S ribosomal protein L24 [Aestuariimicrobium sp. p3-SID1156]|uniref:50S ribosomal protein L24 n=1 Tax=Aestuariimicrobium sp. p3-SID1156 TaxID=2916038 RepID=UPI00223A9B2C|nr:50S ribosomal protein L24 [Aestuariimicrobium sp. p3-SID1156]MCT1460192.1 50S ribosomal protein L24 [Aestuariimicrobium sp. p3-SID1156]